MADITVTAADVLPVGDVEIRTGTAQDTITAGQSIHKDSSDGAIYLSDSDSGTTARRAITGISVNSASPGQRINYIVDGQLDIGGTVAIGTVYVVSNTAGGVAPVSDLGSGDRVSVIGVGTTATNIELGIFDSGIDIA